MTKHLETDKVTHCRWNKFTRQLIYLTHSLNCLRYSIHRSHFLLHFHKVPFQQWTCIFALKIKYCVVIIGLGNPINTKLFHIGYFNPSMGYWRSRDGWRNFKLSWEFQNVALYTSLSLSLYMYIYCTHF